MPHNTYKAGYTIELLNKRLAELGKESELVKQEIQRLQYSEFEEDIRESENQKLLKG